MRKSKLISVILFTDDILRVMEFDSELSALCQEIDQHYLKIREYKDNAANLKGEKNLPVLRAGGRY